MAAGAHLRQAAEGELGALLVGDEHRDALAGLGLVAERYLRARAAAGSASRRRRPRRLAPATPRHAASHARRSEYAAAALKQRACRRNSAAPAHLRHIQPVLFHRHLHHGAAALGHLAAPELAEAHAKRMKAGGKS